MKKISLVIILSLALSFAVYGKAEATSTYCPSPSYCIPTSASTQSGGSSQTTFTGGQINYAPLEPLSAFETDAGTYNSFAKYLSTIFTLLLTIGSMFAVVMLVYGGVTYMTSGVSNKLVLAKNRMTSALVGLGLLAGAWLILYTINPQLLVFNLDPKKVQVTGGSSGMLQTPSGTTQSSYQQYQQNLVDIGNGTKVPTAEECAAATKWLNDEGVPPGRAAMGGPSYERSRQDPAYARQVTTNIMTEAVCNK